MELIAQYYYNKQIKLHNLNGPAVIEQVDKNPKIKKYYIEGVEYSKSDWQELAEKKILEETNYKKDK